MTLEFELRNYVKRDGTCPIRIRITIDRKPQYYNTGEYVKSNQWDKKKLIVKNHPLENQINSHLKGLENEIKTFYYKNDSLSSKALINLFKESKKTGGGDLIAFYQSYIDDLELKYSPISARTYKIYLRNLIAYSPEAHFKICDDNFIRSFERYLLKKGNTVNTVANNLGALKNITSKALQRDLISKDPFYKFTIKRETTKKTYLTYDEIKIIEQVEIPREFNMLRMARDMFLLSFYTSGMRYTDICLLEWKHIKDDMIQYTMNKSKTRPGSNREIAIMEKTTEVINRQRGNDKTFVFNILKGFENKSHKEKLTQIQRKNKEVGRALKSIRKRAGIETNFSFHTAKHSFANFALERKVSVKMMQNLLGHAFLSTTEQYLRNFDHSEQKETMKKMFE